MKTPKPTPDAPVEDTTLPLDGPVLDAGAAGADTPEAPPPEVLAAEAVTAEDAAPQGPTEGAAAVEREAPTTQPDQGDPETDATGEQIVIEDEPQAVSKDDLVALAARLKQVVGEIEARNTDRLRAALVDDLTRHHTADFGEDGLRMGPIFARGTGQEQQLTNWANKARRSLLELQAI